MSVYGRWRGKGEVSHNGDNGDNNRRKEVEKGAGRQGSFSIPCVTDDDPGVREAMI